MRASSLLLLALAGCGHPTALDVTITFDSASQHPDALKVTLSTGGAPLRMDSAVTAPGNRPLRSGDDFVILLPDSLDATAITIDVQALEKGALTMRGVGTATAARGRTTPAAIALAAPCAPGASVCTDGVEITCPQAGGGFTSRPCPFGCSGTHCGGEKCSNPGKITTSGVYSGSSADDTDDATGSCAASAGPDLVAEVAVAAWSTLTLDSDKSGYDTALYLRLQCDTPASEPPLPGPCVGAATAGGTMCSDDATGKTSRLVACGLPPGSYFSWLDAKGPGGPFQLAATLTPVSLATCSEAGNLLTGGTWPAATKPGASNFTNTLCPDHGATAPEAFFFFVLTAPRAVTLSAQGKAGFKLSIAVTKDCMGMELACDSSKGNQAATVTTPTLMPGTYFVIVDGQASASGDFTITFN